MFSFKVFFTILSFLGLKVQSYFQKPWLSNMYKLNTSERCLQCSLNMCSDFRWEPGAHPCDYSWCQRWEVSQWDGSPCQGGSELCRALSFLRGACRQGVCQQWGTPCGCQWRTSGTCQLNPIMLDQFGQGPSSALLASLTKLCSPIPEA